MKTALNLAALTCLIGWLPLAPVFGPVLGLVWLVFAPFLGLGLAALATDLD